MIISNVANIAIVFKKSKKKGLGTGDWGQGRMNNE